MSKTSQKSSVQIGSKKTSGLSIWKSDGKLNWPVILMILIIMIVVILGASYVGVLPAMPFMVSY